MLAFRGLNNRTLLHSLRAFTSTASSSELNDALRARIDKMIKSDPVVVFMKGTQHEPMCGFSKNVKLVCYFLIIFGCGSVNPWKFYYSCYEEKVRVVPKRDLKHLFFFSYLYFNIFPFTFPSVNKKPFTTNKGCTFLCLNRLPLIKAAHSCAETAISRIYYLIIHFYLSRMHNVSIYLKQLKSRAYDPKYALRPNGWRTIRPNATELS